MTGVKVFVSYSWGVEGKTGIVDEIEALCPPRDIQLVRDKHAMRHGDVIMDFMNDLTSGDHILTVFSKPYFKSPWCMYELLKIWQKGDFKQRTHALFADDCDLQDTAYRIGIVKHWVAEHEKIKGLLEGVDPALLGKEYERANTIRDIGQNAGDLVNFAAGRLTTPLAELRDQGYAQILDQISKVTGVYDLMVGNAQGIKEERALDSGKARRIQQLDEQIISINETLHNYEMELIDAYHHAQKSSLKKDIAGKKELLKQKNLEYKSVIEGLDESDFSEDEAEPAMAEIVQVVENEPGGLSQEIRGQLAFIRQEIQDQNKSATAKLKVTLPIVPLLANYELDLDTENFLGELWGKVRGLLKKKASNVNP